MIMQLVSILSLILAFGLPSVAVTSDPGPNQRGEVKGINKTRQEARRIWEQAIAAKGGRERLYAVKNLVISTSGEYRASSPKTNVLKTEALFVFPNKIWRWSDYRPEVFGLRIEMYNYDANKYYLATPGSTQSPPSQILSKENSTDQTYGLLSYLMETKWLKPTPISASKARVGHQSADVVQTSLGDKRIDFAIDKQTHLPIRVSYYHTLDGKEVLDIIENLSDYTEVNGIKIPRKRKVDNMVDSLNILFNVEYNEDIFTKPPLIEAGAEAWRSKSK